MKTKDYFIFFATFLLIWMVLIVQTDKNVLAANPIELRVTAGGCNLSGATGQGLYWFAKEVERRTKGEVKVKILWGTSLCKMTEVPGAIKSGMADMGLIITVYFPELFPYHGASQAAMLMASAGLGDWYEPYMQLCREFPEARDVYKKQNQKLISIFDNAGLDLMTKTPVRNFKDAKGYKIRLSGEYLPRLFKEAGFSTISIPASEAYDALHRGLANGVHVSYPVIMMFKWYEPCKYVTVLPLFGTSLVYALTINLNTWNKLSGNAQNTISKIGEELSKSIYPYIHFRLNEDFMEFFPKVGGKFVKFDEGDVKEWRKRIQKPAMEYYIKKMENKGIPRAREIISRFAELMNYKWQK